MGWNGNHIHTWAIFTDVKMNIRADGENIPFCAWICRCGQWKWRLSPEALFRKEHRVLYRRAVAAHPREISLGSWAHVAATALYLHARN